jgi:hypothetical protein
MIRSLPLAVLTHPVNAWATENVTMRLGQLRNPLNTQTRHSALRLPVL